MCNLVRLMYFLVAYFVAGCSSSTYQGSLFVLDISEILKDFNSNEADIKSAVEWFVQYHSGNQKKEQVHLYYEYSKLHVK